MNELNTMPADPDPGVIELSKMLGARQAMGMIAGRCSAADAEMLRNIRDQKKYLNLSATWGEFCEKHLHMSKRHADRTIQLLKELGPAYFELSQVTRISPEEFRAIAAHVDAQGIHLNGEAIALIEANSGKVAAAVSELRGKPAHTPRPEARPAELKQLERRCDRLRDDIARLRDKGDHPQALAEMAHMMTEAFTELHMTILMRSR